MKKKRYILAAVVAVFLLLFCISVMIVERRNTQALQVVAAEGVSGHPTILIDAGRCGRRDCREGWDAGKGY